MLSSDEVIPSSSNHWCSWTTDQARRHAFQALKFQPRPLISVGASIIACQLLNPSWPMAQRLIASLVGRPLDRTSGSRRVTASMKSIHWPGLFSVPRARSSSA